MEECQPVFPKIDTRFYLHKDQGIRQDPAKSETIEIMSWVRIRIGGDGLSPDEYFFCKVLLRNVLPDDSPKREQVAFKTLQQFYEQAYMYLHCTKIDFNIRDAFDRPMFYKDTDQRPERIRMIELTKQKDE